MALSFYVAPNSSFTDTYAIYVAFDTNETSLEPPTELNFDLLFLSPNRTLAEDSTEELRHTIFMPPAVHLGNGTYIFGVKLISQFSRVLTLTLMNKDFRFERRNKSDRVQFELCDEYLRLEMSVLGRDRVELEIRRM